MSYGFDLNFIHRQSIGGAFVLALAASEALWKSRVSFVESEDVFIPSVRYSFQEGRTERLSAAEDEAWLTRLFQMNFIWWPEYKLLALLGSGWPKAVGDMFKSHVYFQNSCDQDYEFDEWKGLRSPFKEIVESAKAANKDGVIELMDPEGRYSVEEYDFEETDMDYYRRTAAYRAIFRALDLDNWLWGHDSSVRKGSAKPVFTRFTLTPINTTERAYEAKVLVRGIANTRKHI